MNLQMTIPELMNEYLETEKIISTFKTGCLTIKDIEVIERYLEQKQFFTRVAKALDFVIRKYPSFDLSYTLSFDFNEQFVNTVCIQSYNANDLYILDTYNEISRAAKLMKEKLADSDAFLSSAYKRAEKPFITVDMVLSALEKTEALMSNCTADIDSSCISEVTMPLSVNNIDNASDGIENNFEASVGNECSESNSEEHDCDDIYNIFDDNDEPFNKYHFEFEALIVNYNTNVVQEIIYGYLHCKEDRTITALDTYSGFRGLDKEERELFDMQVADFACDEVYQMDSDNPEDYDKKLCETKGGLRNKRGYEIIIAPYVNMNWYTNYIGRDYTLASIGVTEPINRDYKFRFCYSKELKKRMALIAKTYYFNVIEGINVYYNPYNNTINIIWEDKVVSLAFSESGKKGDVYFYTKGERISKDNLVVSDGRVANYAFLDDEDFKYITQTLCFDIDSIYSGEYGNIKL